MTEETELIVLVDEDGNPIGTAEKLPSHHRSTPLHLAFSCFVFNDDHDCLVTRRAAAKKVWPGVWTNSVCGHPGPDEATVAAIRRRSRYELGMDVRDIQIVLPDYRYKTPAYRGIIENEICPVYLARTSDAPKPNPAEVEAVRWSSWTDLLSEAQTDNGNSWSWWCKDQLSLLRGHRAVVNYLHADSPNGSRRSSEFPVPVTDRRGPLPPSGTGN